MGQCHLQVHSLSLLASKFLRLLTSWLSPCFQTIESYFMDPTCDQGVCGLVYESRTVNVSDYIRALMDSLSLF